MRILAIAATVVLIVLSGAAIVGAFALLARRLLGLGFGLVRLLLAGLIGFAVAGPIAQAMAGSVSTRGSAIAPVWFLILAAAAALLVAMTFLVVAEALVPSGSLPNPLELRRQLRGRIARVRRYWQISRIAIHHGLLPYLRGRREELDFRIEAGNMAAVAASRGSGDGVLIPTPYDPLCTQRVLVMQRLDGTPPGRRAARAAGLRLGRPPGPLAPRRPPAPAAGDGPRRPAGRQRRAARGGPASDEIDQQALERALGEFIARHLGPGMRPGMRMFTDLFRIVSEHGLSVPPQIAAVFRALATLEGALTQLEPGFDLVAEARASTAGQGPAQALDPATARQLVTDELTTLLPMLRRLPRRIERIASAAEHGRLSVQVRLFADERDRRHVTGLLHQVLLTILAATAGIMAVLLLGTGGGPRVTTAVSLYQLFGYNLLVICSILALRVLVLIFRPDR